ncbi:MAG: flavodoxin family protein [Clostridiales bacterium]|nr:flavodoxin family protein [Clostridiales bacterium]
MKTLIINGSANKNGECRKLIEMFNRGINAEVLDLAELNIAPCSDCGGCKNCGQCVINDDMGKIYPLVEEADFLVFASPLYFSSLTGLTLNFLSRFQKYYLGKNKALKPKKALLLMTGGGSTKTKNPAPYPLQLALRYINCELTEVISYINCDEKSFVFSEETKEKLNAFKEKYFKDITFL